MQEYVKRINPDSIVAEVVKPGEELEVAQAKVITEKMLTITEVTSGFKVLSLELDLIGKQLYNHDNFVCRFYYDSYTSQEFVSFPELKLTVRASNNNLYDVYLKEITFNVRINQVHAKHFYCELVEEKEYVVYQTDFRGNRVQAYTYHQESKTPELDRLEKINAYIKSDDLFWDFSYLESLLDEMSDKELEEFCSAKYLKSKDKTYRGVTY